MVDLTSLQRKILISVSQLMTCRGERRSRTGALGILKAKKLERDIYYNNTLTHMRVGGFELRPPRASIPLFYL